MIGLKNVTFSYQKSPVLNNFSLELSAGSRVCLTGSSGCGKTTVLHLLCGLIHPQSGTVIASPATMVFQEDRLLPWKTVLQNVSLILKEDNADEVAAYWLDKVGLSDVKDAYPHTLSGGMKRRVAIARALAAGGELLLLDEPFTGLDAENKALMLQLLSERFASATIVLVTHLLEEANTLQAEIVEM